MPRLARGLVRWIKRFLTSRRRAVGWFTINASRPWPDNRAVLLPFMQLSYAWHSFFLRPFVTKMAHIVRRLTN
ncbi:hypothetical protein PLUA15_350012 [Pseudomonas lundensis]|uniref:Uncharacterized protein n=1 Tax=Pseudomonas lundensis TaxID=86185 RepID=A0AAX2HAT4_9PSED|nr:hypothetical protein PLUA15_350012 [Pseudomonas lundensis]